MQVKFLLDLRGLAGRRKGGGGGGVWGGQGGRGGGGGVRREKREVFTSRNLSNTPPGSADP